MNATHLELLVEESSMEQFLRALLPRLLPAGRTFEVHAFQGKPDLLGKLEARLRAYSTWLPADWRVIVVVDRDNEDCLALKSRLEATARRAGLRTPSLDSAEPWQIVIRIAIEELEAWYFGCWDAVHRAYPRVSPTVPRGAAYRDPDAIAGGTWETFERVMQRHRYFPGGLRKLEAARAIGEHVVDPGASRSTSFRHFWHAIEDASSSAGAGQ